MSHSADGAALRQWAKTSQNRRAITPLKRIVLPAPSRAHDEKLVQLAAKHVDDAAALVDIARKGRAEIENVLSGDQTTSPQSGDHAWAPPDRIRE